MIPSKVSYALLGASGHAKVIIGALRAAGFPICVAFDDDPSKHGQHLLDVPIAGGLRQVREYPSCCFLAALGHNRTRQNVVTAYHGLSWGKVVHPHSWIGADVQIGEGTVIFAGAIVQPSVSIGSHTIINTSASIDHDCQIGDFVHIAPGVHLAGGVIIQEGAFLGVGASVIPNITIGRWAVVGAGTAVIRNVAEGEVVGGVPARPLKSKRCIS